jgi:hypothetical protein
MFRAHEFTFCYNGDQWDDIVWEGDDLSTCPFRDGCWASDHEHVEYVRITIQRQTPDGEWVAA